MGGEEARAAPRARAAPTVTAEELLEGIREDFVERQYLWSGDIDPELYDESCTFTDPTLSFQGLDTFERNIRNLRPILDALLPEERRRCILRNLEQDSATGRVFAEWTMVGDLSLPWKPRINLGGRTTYTPGTDGRIVSYDETWDISAGDALLQILAPTLRADEPAEHWPGRLRGAPAPQPRVKLTHAPAFVVLPGFLNDAVDYAEPLGQVAEVGLQACLARRGISAAIAPVQRLNWLKVFLTGLQDEDFRAGNGTASVAFGWYLDMAQALVEESVRSSGGPVVLLGHSAGGWLARALMCREGRGWVEANVRGLVTLGAPHLPPPEDQEDMTQGCLTNLNAEHPGAFFSDLIFYVTVSSDSITGKKKEGNLPILELIESQSEESTAFNSYAVMCGDGGAAGDGIVPLASAHLEGAEQLTLKGCLHSINVAGSLRPTDRSYLCEYFVDDWLEPVAKKLHKS